MKVVLNNKITTLPVFQFFLTFFIKGFLKCLHLLISSNLLFNFFRSLVKLIIHSFPVKHNLHKSGLVLPYIFVIIVHLTEKADVIRFQLPDVFCQFCTALVLLMFQISNVISVTFFKSGVS